MEKENLVSIAKEILVCKEVKALPLKGARNIGIFVSVGKHRFSDKFERASCKFYRGNGYTTGFQEGYMPFHKNDFPQIEVLKNPNIQQSLEADIWQDSGKTYPYAVFQFIEGKMLRDYVGNKDNPITSATLSEAQAKSILRDMFCKVWIPIWASGMRFRDGHTGNWVLSPSYEAYMIDTEQMRKDSAELLRNPNSWTQRNKHEKSCLKLIHGIFADLVNASGKKITDSDARKILNKTTFLEKLSNLGRNKKEELIGMDQASSEFEILLDRIFE